MQQVIFAFDAGGRNLADAVAEAVGAAGYLLGQIPGSGSLDYPELALKGCKALLGASDAHSAILVCGTGVGMSIAANKIRGIRAARCTDPYATERARRSNNANVLTFGGEVVGPGLAATLVSVWLQHDFDSQRSIPKVAAVEALDQGNYDV